MLISNPAISDAKVLSVTWMEAWRVYFKVVLQQFSRNIPWQRQQSPHLYLTISQSDTVLLRELKSSNTSSEPYKWRGHFDLKYSDHDQKRWPAHFAFDCRIECEDWSIEPVEGMRVIERAICVLHLPSLMTEADPRYDLRLGSASEKKVGDAIFRFKPCRCRVACRQETEQKTNKARPDDGNNPLPPDTALASIKRPRSVASNES